MKLQTTLFLFLIACCTHAQVTITSADAPAIGEALGFAVDTIPLGFAPSAPGPDQTWDFTTLSQDFTYTETLVDPAGTPGEDDYPDATGALEQVGALYSYIQNADDGLYVLGLHGDFLGTGAALSVPFDPPQRRFAYPSTYGTTYNDDYNVALTIASPIAGADSVRVKNTSTAVSEIDAYGVVETPFGIYNALRQKVTTTTDFSLEVLVFGFWITQQSNTTTEVTYDFYNKEVKGRLLSYSLDSVGMAGQITYSTIPGAQQGVPPVASFEAADQGNNTFTFTDASYDDITNRTWDFGDGNTMTTAATSVDHTYAVAGDYTVCLTVENNFGTDMLCKPLTVIAPPVSAFTFSDAFDGLINFQDASSGGPATWAWDFGDGNMSSEQNPSHTFASTGSYNVCLTVSNAVGSNTTCQTVVPIFKPVAAFTYVDPSTGTVTFTDESTNAPNSWSWDFGDGSTSAQQNPAHDFSSGQYTVCLTASNVAGSNQKCEDLMVIIASLQDIEQPLALQVFPNPATDFLHLQLAETLDEAATLVIYNAVGQKMHTSIFQDQQLIDLQSWSTGTYSWNILSEKGQRLAKGSFAIVK